MKGKNRRFAGYRLEDIWADPDEIQGMIETMEMTYPGMGGEGLCDHGRAVRPGGV